MSWQDQIHNWDPKDFGGIRKLTVSPHDIWVPDIFLYSSISRRNIEKDTLDINILLGYDGICQWIPPIIYQSSCETNMRDFPFDVQNCSLKFGSWVHSSEFIDIRIAENTPVDLSEYLENAEFTMLETFGVRKLSNYSCCSDTYIDIFFYLVLRRKSEFYVQVYF
ncbi:DgyrCDS5640 [Dimorphilus gyrociliatus]|uniref:DgyrCDS5640 n=1 Tax=Dimorphilus gyrociliatus TaxID=2664684 RepID=A0A7I8VN77_9ANNE|nr:DgyrCDS5640 [Dimorphilus gyrociliatus]